VDILIFFSATTEADQHFHSLYSFVSKFPSLDVSATPRQRIGNASATRQRGRDNLQLAPPEMGGQKIDNCYDPQLI
jgi:hypothetical protein